MLNEFLYSHAPSVSFIISSAFSGFGKKHVRPETSISYIELTTPIREISLAAKAAIDPAELTRITYNYYLSPFSQGMGNIMGNISKVALQPF